MIDTNSILFRLTTDAVFVFDRSGRVKAANSAASQKLRVPVSSIVGTSIFDLIQHESGRLKRFTESSLAERDPIILDFGLPGGGHILMRCCLEFDPASGDFVLICQHFAPIPEEDHLRWRLALESSEAGYWGYDINADVMFFSSRFDEMLGYEPGELSPSFETLVNTVHPDDRAMVDDNVLRFNSSKNYSYRYEVRLIKKNGDVLWVLAMGARLCDSEGNEWANGWRIDIHDRKMMEMKLRESEEKSRTLLASLPDIIFIHDREGCYLEVHSEKDESLLIPKQDLVGKYVGSSLAPDLAAKSLAAIRAAIDHGTVSTLEYDLDVPQGRSFFEARVTPNFDGKTALTVIRDITESRMAQAAKRESDLRLHDFIDNCPVVLFNLQLKNGEAIYTYAGGRVEEMFEVPASELIGRSLGYFKPPFVHAEDLESAKEALERALSTMSGIQWTGRIVLPSGRIRWINVVGRARRNDDQTLIFSGITMDVTHERMLAQKVREQQALMSSSARLASLGEMAGGIAHEINNPLTVAHAHAARLRDIAQSGKTLERDVVINATEKIEAVCMRISRIIAGLRSIARDGESDRFVFVHLAPIIGDALSLCSEKLRHRLIDFRVGKIPDTLKIECRSVQISQILVNLLLNAEHAVDSQKDSRWVSLNVVDLDSHVEIRIADSGPGIPKHLREKIFDPFFTTKEVGKGTGLGLSVSASLARAHEGVLYLDSSAPHTTFVLRLPKRQDRGQA